MINNFPKLQPILSAIDTAVYGRVKFFVTLRKCFTMNDDTLHDSFEFANDTTNQSSKCFMASLFINVSFDETIQICIDELFKFEMTVPGLY